MQRETLLGKTYYDTLTTLCSCCYYYERKTRQVGRYEEYDCCHLYGYILHDDEGISVSCDGYRTEEQYRVEERNKSLLKKKKKM